MEAYLGFLFIVCGFAVLASAMIDLAGGWRDED
jgi:hypothetical protein